QIRAEVKNLFAALLAFRDSQANNNRTAIINQARTYIDRHFSDANLSLNEVAAQVNFSPNHFSAVFSEETGGTFRDYLTGARLEQARKLLRSTRLKCSEVAFQCGYNDPHYFSMIFRKNTGQTPQQFRHEARLKTQKGSQAA
ncbi:MAG: AraC family transcriptional regulator, partial [Chloroflexi bacterium]